MSFGQVFFIKFVIDLPEWASGDKNYMYCINKKKHVHVHVAPIDAYFQGEIRSRFRLIQ